MNPKQQEESLFRFVNKRMRERLSFELSRPDKRLRGIARFSNSIETVSYTHLDVYKRQG